MLHGCQSSATGPVSLRTRAAPRRGCWTGGPASSASCPRPKLRRRSFTPVHDRGRGLVDVAVMLADGGEAIADIEVLRHQAPVLGPVASAPTVWRALDGLTRSPGDLPYIDPFEGWDDHARAAKMPPRPRASGELSPTWRSPRGY